jgi:hypothetical protein
VPVEVVDERLHEVGHGPSSKAIVEASCHAYNCDPSAKEVKFRKKFAKGSRRRLLWQSVNEGVEEGGKKSRSIFKKWQT